MSRDAAADRDGKGAAPQQKQRGTVLKTEGGHMVFLEERGEKT